MKTRRIGSTALEVTEVSFGGAALGGLLFGLDTAVISGTTSALQARFALSDPQLGFTVASALIGTIVGALVAGWPSDRFGRKPLLLTVAILYVASSLGSALAESWPAFLAFRFPGGLAIGAGGRARTTRENRGGHRGSGRRSERPR